MSKYEGRCHFPQDRPGILLILDSAGDSRNFSKSVNSDPRPIPRQLLDTCQFQRHCSTIPLIDTTTNPIFPGRKKSRELLASRGLCHPTRKHLHHEPHGNAQFTAWQLDSTPIQACVNFQPIHPITPQERAPTRAISDPFRS